MSESRALVEHFFRHEFGRLVAVLTRSLGVRRLDLVEDVVQAALVQALETWSRRGVPEDPAGWLYRTARNLAIDALRRERTHAQALPRLAEDAERESAPLEAHFADEIGDEPLRPALLREVNAIFDVTFDEYDDLVDHEAERRDHSGGEPATE
jgi:RNA polymerase sigma factor (sigma-70 family)